ncbi:MAG: DUF368 domain-containing protein [Clostridia bacterium]|nr:DUF368 domain-containing protein [Clostridia bacterium]
MKYFIDAIKGIIIGVANIIPGISGGTLAIVMGIYDKLINAVTEIFKNPIKAIKSVWIYAAGISIGVILSIIGVSYFLDTNPIPTTALFVGLIVGSIPIIIGQVENKKVDYVDIIVFSLLLFMVIALPYLNFSGTDTQADTSNFFIMIILGILAAFSIVAPGVSGTMILMSLGYYEKLMSITSELIKATLKFDVQAIISNFVVMLPFGIGIVIGIVLTAKLIKWLFEKYSKASNWGILGLLVASPFPVILNLNISTASTFSLIFGVISFAVGIVASNLLIKLNK